MKEFKSSLAILDRIYAEKRAQAQSILSKNWARRVKVRKFRSQFIEEARLELAPFALRRFQRLAGRPHSFPCDGTEAAYDAVKKWHDKHHFRRLIYVYLGKSVGGRRKTLYVGKAKNGWRRAVTHGFLTKTEMKGGRIDLYHVGNLQQLARAEHLAWHAFPHPKWNSIHPSRTKRAKCKVCSRAQKAWRTIETL
jgi:hypothetical protein